MADKTPAGDPGKCDTIDHGVTSDRFEKLKSEAHAFNKLLQDSDSLPTKASKSTIAQHRATIAQDENEFYTFVPRTDAATGNAVLDASNAFYVQLTNLPIGERRALIKLTQKENDDLSKSDAKMPKMEIDQYDDAFIKSLDFHFEMGSLTYHFEGRAMCAQTPDFEQPNQPPQTKGVGDIALPTLHRRR